MRGGPAGVPSGAGPHLPRIALSAALIDAIKRSAADGKVVTVSHREAAARERGSRMSSGTGGVGRTGRHRCVASDEAEA